MKIRIVVADEREASLFDVRDVSAPLELAAKIENPSAGLKGIELESDRPGRSFDSTSPHRHAMDGERASRRWHEQATFARTIVDELENGRNRHEFDRLIVMAGPRMLGLIREALPDAARPLLAAEISKDLVHVDADTLRAYVPKDAFRRPSAFDV
jgi:protein required for attachment to host cells